VQSVYLRGTESQGETNWDKITPGEQELKLYRDQTKT